MIVIAQFNATTETIECRAINNYPEVDRNCTHYTENDLKKFAEKISKGYFVQWYVSSLYFPVVERSEGI